MIDNKEHELDKIFEELKSLDDVDNMDLFITLLCKGLKLFPFCNNYEFDDFALMGSHIFINEKNFIKFVEIAKKEGIEREFLLDFIPECCDDVSEKLLLPAFLTVMDVK